MHKSMFKIHSIFLSVLVVSACLFIPISGKAQTSENPRIRYTINDGWKFVREDVGQAGNQDFDDSSWKKVNLPTLGMLRHKRRRAGILSRNRLVSKKKIFINSNLQGKKLYLHFEGANQETEVFINGQKVGDHIGGYMAFTFEITDKVKLGEENLIAVKVDNKHNENIRRSTEISVFTAEFTAISGWLRRTICIFR